MDLRRSASVSSGARACLQLHRVEAGREARAYPGAAHRRERHGSGGDKVDGAGAAVRKHSRKSHSRDSRRRRPHRRVLRHFGVSRHRRHHDRATAKTDEAAEHPTCHPGPKARGSRRLLWRGRRAETTTAVPQRGGGQSSKCHGRDHAGISRRHMDRWRRHGSNQITCLCPCGRLSLSRQHRPNVSLKDRQARAKSETADGGVPCHIERSSTGVGRPTPTLKKGAGLFHRHPRTCEDRDCDARRRAADRGYDGSQDPAAHEGHLPPQLQG